MKPQLSISLLASDRPDTLKKCLDSLMPILNTIPSELIVVFTGKDPETERIIKQYTKQVIPFTWCDDFSAARNAGLEKAVGEWFLFIDDDEWFENTEEICTFFQSGEYKGYGSASYRVRNYNNSDGSEYIDIELPRMVQRTENVKFCYTIHEELYPRKMPVKRLNDFVHHYGYATGEKKYKRNIPLLLKELEKDNKNLKTYTQLACEYKAARRYREGEKYCGQGVKVLRQERQPFTVEDWLLAFYPWFIGAQGDYERMWEEAEKILKEDKPNELACAELYLLLGNAGMSLERYGESLEYIEKYHQTLCWMEKNQDICQAQAVAELQYREIRRERKELYLYGLEYAVRLEDYGAVEKLLKWILEDKKEENKRYYMEQMDAWKEKHPKQTEDILTCFSHLSSEDGYVHLQQALYKESLGDIDGAKQRFCRCVEDGDAYLRWQWIEMSIREGWELSPVMEQMHLSVWTDCARTIVQKLEISQWDAFSAKAEKVLVPFPLHYAVIQRFLLEKKLRFGKLEDAAFLEGMEQYAESVVGYYRCLYKEELFAENRWFCLPDICCFAMLILSALNEKRRNHYRECIHSLRKAIHIQPDMQPLITRLVEQIDQEINRPKEAEASEFTLLGEKIKATVRELFAKKQYSEALPIVNQLLQLLPNDEEVYELRRELLNHMPFI